ncbi:MAG: hypothetical protein KBD76_16210, partial [Bacteriovorax sp.]|nr:hypothetical protein [Bacteriovorax sp.]
SRGDLFGLVDAYAKLRKDRTYFEKKLRITNPIISSSESMVHSLFYNNQGLLKNLAFADPGHTVFLHNATIEIGQTIRYGVNTHLALEEGIGFTCASINNPSDEVKSACQKIIETSEQVRNLYIVADVLAFRGEDDSYEELMSNLQETTNFMVGFSKSLAEKAVIVGAGAAMVALAPNLAIGGLVAGVSYALINFDETKEMIRNLVETSSNIIMNGSAKERGELFGSLSGEIAGLFYGGSITRAAEKALLPAVARATTRLAVEASTALAFARNVLSEEGAAGMNVLASEAPEVARNIFNLGKSEVAGLLLDGNTAGANSLIKNISEKGDEKFEKIINSAIISSKDVVSEVGNKKFGEILRLPKGSRPSPETYLTKEYIESHLAKFDDGASKFMRKSDFENYGPAQVDGTAFVLSKIEADKIINLAAGNKRSLEESLGFPSGFLDSNELVRIDISKPRYFNIRIPSGNEPGTNSLWLPGGKLPNGNYEGVLDLGNASPNGWVFTPVNL